MKMYGLIGYPLTHSFSKKYFEEKFEKLELADHQYQLFSTASIAELPGILDQYPDLKGLNITIPYKQQVLSFLHDRSGIPAALNACNCISIIAGKLYGYNTDVIGFEDCIMPQLNPAQNKALILGNGGAAAAVKYVFEKNNIDYNIVSRQLDGRARFTYETLTKAIIKQHLIIVNTTPLGMYPNVDTYPPIPYEAIGRGHHLFDLTYNPVKTLFLQKGEQQGASIQNGAAMLGIQAEASWKIWQNDR